ncbi:hypothetical protein [Oryza sativa Japonica Group]|uniref:Uncharacterized protein n=1 Tax=Oryza sativa subsp. japonica TaxID=39947 RepID=Q5JKP5_ORYSJ|nr:hypothetical protein [Oryza sativa Japonica Group]
MAEGADNGDGAPGRSSQAVRARGGARRPSMRGEELACRPHAGEELELAGDREQRRCGGGARVGRSSPSVRARGRIWSSPVVGSSGGRRRRPVAMGNDDHDATRPRERKGDKGERGREEEEGKEREDVSGSHIF